MNPAFTKSLKTKATSEHNVIPTIDVAGIVPAAEEFVIERKRSRYLFFVSRYGWARTHIVIQYDIIVDFVSLIFHFI